MCPYIAFKNIDIKTIKLVENAALKGKRERKLSFNSDINILLKWKKIIN